jgi:hypothetical protein
MDTPEIAKKLNNQADLALQNKSISSSKPKITKQFTIDLRTYFREYLKIAYELAFCKYGMDYVMNSQSAHNIREAIKSGEVEKYQIIGEIPYLPKKEMDLYPTAEHELLFCGNVIAIKIFGIWGRIKVFEGTEHVIQRKDDFFQRVINQDSEAKIDECSGGLIIWHKHMNSPTVSSGNAKEE